MNKGGRLDRPSRVLIPHEIAGDPPEFAVNVRRETSEGGLIATRPRAQKMCRFRRLRVFHGVRTAAIIPSPGGPSKKLSLSVPVFDLNSRL